MWKRSVVLLAIVLVGGVDADRMKHDHDSSTAESGGFVDSIISPFNALVDQITSFGKDKPESSSTAPSAGEAVNFPFPRITVRRQSSSTGNNGNNGSTGNGAKTNTTAITVTPHQRGTGLDRNPPQQDTTLERAMLFTICPETATQYDRASVNWIPVDGQNKTHSILQYRLCNAASLQPRFVAGFSLRNEANAFGSASFMARSMICGAFSPEQTPCENRVTKANPCLIGTTTLPVPFDPMATMATLTVLTAPPATTAIKMCL